ncbi:hypothetical protein BGZ65_003995 [Modicella reniformis]|uniref:Uncharacterized protein n=1 Tax=Modicella reniformis TaxID=1440133 RepID=A0A9P6ILG3_9FUNG|nr:hypothetical protein BGZ65_003995 [Modicella reniformis]
MVVISTTLRFWQGWKSVAAAKSFKSLVSNIITVTSTMEVPIEDVVSGDWIHLSVCEHISADVKEICHETFFGSMAKELAMRRPKNAFQMGVRDTSGVSLES